MSMTQNDAIKIARLLADAKPNPATATVGERLLWGRLVRKLQDHLICNARGFNIDTWRAELELDPQGDDE